MALPIIFLDFDGVIRVPCDYATDPSMMEFCPERLALLDSLCSALGLSIVVSSDWRVFHKREEIEALLGRVSRHLHDDWRTGVFGCRWQEISKWLEKHKVQDPFLFVVLDDEPRHFHGGGWIEERLVLCDPYKGLTQMEVSKVCGILLDDMHN